jgi:hypothetical protein
MNHGYSRESTESLKEIGEIAKTMADIEELEGH